jgi:hypothetical protein
MQAGRTSAPAGEEIASGQHAVASTDISFFVKKYSLDLSSGLCATLSYILRDFLKNYSMYTGGDQHEKPFSDRSSHGLDPGLGRRSGPGICPEGQRR